MKADIDLPDLTQRQAFIVLNALPEIGPIVLNRLLEDLGGDPRRVLAADAHRLQRVTGVRPPAVASIIGWRAHFNLASEEEKLAESGADFIAACDSGYPEPLRQIHDPPIGIYRLGGYAFERPGIAIVGTRRATHYGRAVARQLASEFARSGFCVVSGLALGVDTAAHEGALAVAGRTLAVLGTGIDLAYPPENRRLKERIVENGAVLSESPFGRHASRQSFPIRNRIVSGLCAAVIVVESDVDGGAMITARLAGEQGRPLFAVPGRIDQPTSAGCHQLIRDGATLLTGVDDVLQELSYLGGLRPPPVAEKPGGSIAERANLTGHEALILQHLAGGEIVPSDEIGVRTGLGASTVSAALMILEMKGLAAKRLDGRFEAC